MTGLLRSSLVVFALWAASPAAAQWARVEAVPASNIGCVWANADTILAGADSTVHVSTDGGVTWTESEKVGAGVTSVLAVRMRNGRIYAGTYGQGVRVSDDLGGTWSAFNQGLTGGLFNSHLFIKDLLLRGDSLFAATAGAGCYVRNLATTSNWSHFGNAFEPNQASNMNAVSAGGSRLLASAGANGTVFFRDPGASDWTLSWLDNVGIEPGLAALTAIWTGRRWVVGSNVGVFHSALGQEPWEFSDPGLGTLFTVSFALRGRDLFASFGRGGGTVVAWSRDDGATWQTLESPDFAFTQDMTIRGTDLYAARFDGLWRRSVANVSSPAEAAPVRLGLAVATSGPSGPGVRFRLDLPAAGPVLLEVFDVTGRRVAEPARGAWPAGRHEVAWDARELSPGVYLARLTSGGQRASARIVRLHGAGAMPR